MWARKDFTIGGVLGGLVIEAPLLLKPARCFVRVVPSEKLT
jgi:hypothetical protein